MENIIDITEMANEAATAFKDKMVAHLNAPATHDNFHLATSATFVPCAKPDRAPDYVSDSGSEYWYVGDTVIRNANHWGIVASCKWSYNGKESDDYVSGACELSEFSWIGRPQPMPTVIDGGTTYTVILTEKRKPVATMTVRSNGKFGVASKVKFALGIIGHEVLESLGLTFRCGIKFA